MEIQVKTYDETRSERVSIAVSAGQKIEIQLVAPNEVEPGTKKGLRNQITNLEAAINRQIENIAELERQLEVANSQRRDYDKDRHTERDRADRVTAELKEQTRHLSTITAELKVCRDEEKSKRFTLAEVENAKTEARISEGARIRSEIRTILDDEDVIIATSRVLGDQARVLVRAIRMIRDLLDN